MDLNFFLFFGGGGNRKGPVIVIFSSVNGETEYQTFNVDLISVIKQANLKSITKLRMVNFYMVLQLLLSESNYV